MSLRSASPALSLNSTASFDSPARSISVVSVVTFNINMFKDNRCLCALFTVYLYLVINFIFMKFPRDPREANLNSILQEAYFNRRMGMGLKFSFYGNYRNHFQRPASTSSDIPTLPEAGGNQLRMPSAGIYYYYYYIIIV